MLLLSSLNLSPSVRGLVNHVMKPAASVMKSKTHVPSHGVFTCVIWFSQHTQITYLFMFNQLLLLMAAINVYC
jgi:hypothetical protein